MFTIHFPFPRLARAVRECLPAGAGGRLQRFLCWLIRCCPQEKDTSKEVVR